MGIRITRQPAIKKGTHYWSCNGCNFVPNADGYDYFYDLDDGVIRITTVAGDEGVFAPVFLPQGAVVTAVKVYGTNAGKSWWLNRTPLNDGAVEQIMANAAVNTEDNTVAFATIDNSLYSYLFVVSVANGDGVYSARITYIL